MLPSLGEGPTSFHFGDGGQSFWKSSILVAGKKPFTDLTLLDHETRTYRAKIDFTPEGGLQGDFIMCFVFVFSENFSAISGGTVKSYGEYGQKTSETIVLGAAPFNYEEIRNNFDKKVENEEENADIDPLFHNRVYVNPLLKSSISGEGRASFHFSDGTGYIDYSSLA